MDGAAITIEERLRATDGRPSGFDFLRLALAIAVLVWHSVVTSQGAAAHVAVVTGPWRPLATFTVPMFFSVSGFLVARSLMGAESLLGFLGLRLLRVYPGLMAHCLLTALVIGPLLTSDPFHAYFTDPRFAPYLGNAVGVIHHELPGLFGGLPLPGEVNGQLWSLPFEILCYLILAASMLVGIARRPGAMLVAAISFWAVGGAATLLSGTPAGAYTPNYLQICCFLAGTLLYQFRGIVHWRGRWAIVAAAAVVTCLSLPGTGELLLPLPAAYLTVFLGLCSPAKPRWMEGLDLSYGTFLWSFTVQQAWMTLGPEVRHWWWNIALALPTTLAIAWCSWTWVEAPALLLRGRMQALGARSPGHAPARLQTA